MPRALGGTSPSTRSPPMSISPDVGRSSPAIIRRSVVLPEPEEPSRTRNSPSRIDRSNPSTAWRSPKCFLRFRISTPATVGALAPGLPPLGRCILLLRQVHRRIIDDVVGALGHLHLLHDVRRWAGCRRCPAAAGTTAATGRQCQEGAPENCHDAYASADVHVFPLASHLSPSRAYRFARETPDHRARRPPVHRGRASPGTSPHPVPDAIPRRSTTPSPALRPRPGLRRGTVAAARPRTRPARGRRRRPARAALA